MKKFLVLVFSCVLCSYVFAQNNVIETELQEVMNQKGDEMIDVSIMFKSQIDAAQLKAKAGRSDDKTMNREIVVSELKDFSSRQQSDVMEILKAEEASGNVADIEALWIVNAISCKANRDVIYKIASHPDVSALSYDKQIQIIDDEETMEVNDMPTRGGAAPGQVGANRVWYEQGYTGKNVVIAVLDTGANIDHKDLSGNLWKGEKDGETIHGWNVIDNNSNITDENGHGTHCAGIALGRNDIGVAPDASLMTVQIASRAGTGSVQNMLDGVQFAIENGADVLSMSLGYRSSQITVAQKESIRKAMDNVMTAGAVVCAAVGNDGNTYGAPNNVDYPAACPSPWRNPDQTLTGGLSSVIAVGANDLGASSQGPSTWQDTEYNDYQYSKWISYCSYSGTFDDAINVYTQTNAYLWAVKYTPNMLGCFTALSKVSLFGSTNDMNVTIKIYEGGDNAPSTLLHTEDKDIVAWSWNDIELSKKVEIDQTKNLWIVFKSNTATTSPAAYGANGANFNAGWISYDNGTTWGKNIMSNTESEVEEYSTWLVRAYMEDNNGNASEIGIIRPDITAPGDQIFSLDNKTNSTYALKSGTSQSTPCVAGVIALMLEKNPDLTPAQISEIIETTAADKPGTKNNVHGAGRIDAWNAVSETETGEQKPYIRLASFAPVSLQQGNNKQINLTLKNHGGEASTSNTKYIISLNNDPYVTLDGSNTITVGSVAAKGVKESSFNVNVNSQTPNGHLAHISLTITDGDLRWEDEFTVRVTALPNIVFKSCNPGIIKPEDGEVELNVVMQNNGTAASLNNTEITLFSIESSLEYFDIIDNSSSVGPLGVNETATASFVIAAKDNAKDNYSLDLFLETFIDNNTPTSVIYEFENDLEGWTTFDAANNYDIYGNKRENIWWHSSEAISHGKTGKNSHSGNGHLMSETSDLSNLPFNNPINDYLVSPNKIMITENSKVSFYARANHESYYEEHFGFAVSSNGNNTESDFETIEEWRITQEQGTTWNKYTVDLSEYAGQEIYVAIRHFFTAEEWKDLSYGYYVDALNVDDIEFSDVIIDYHNVPSSNHDENYFSIVVSNPIDLDAPTGLEVSNITTESITLTWEAVDQAQSYNVYRNGELKANVTATTYTDNYLTHNTEYCYTVAGVHNGNVHEQCEAVCATTLQKDYSVAIKSFTPEVIYIDGNTTTSLDITFVNDGKYQHESRSDITLSSNDEYVTINAATESMNALNPGVEVEKSFEITIDENIPNSHAIRINAKVQYRFVPYTSWDLPITIIVKNDPAAPKGLTATKTENSVTLGWTAVVNAISYNIYRDGECVGNTASTTYYDGGLEANTEYTYQVSSVGANGESEKSKETVVTTAAASNGIVLQSFSMEAGLGQNITLTATLINNGSEATPEATTATLTCEDEYVTIVDGTYELGSMAVGATKDAVFTIKLSESTPLNHVLNFNVTAEYEGEGGGTANNSYTFDNDLEGWTTMTTDDHKWYHSTLQGDHGYDKNYNTGGFIFSESYCNDEYHGFNPDHWIVIPEKIVPSDATSFDFYVCSMSNSYDYADETFGVFVSTTSNTDPKAFTEISKWTLPTNKNSLSMALKSVGLYDYEGQEIWVAIRHYGAGDNAALAVDNVTIYNLVQSSTISTTSSFSVVANSSLNVFAGTGSWSNVSLWSKKSVPTSTEDIAINGDATIESGNITVNTMVINNGSLTINSGASLTVNATFINSKAASLIINDGSQVFQNNDNVAATFKMNMTNPDNWGEHASGWQFISSPVKNANTADFVPENDYDLFKYDGTQELQWVNYKGHSITDFEKTFQQGRGYLASYENETTATFTGILNHETSFNFSDLKAHDTEDHYNNFYLLGNPFTFNMSWANVTAENIYDGGYATINDEGSYEYHGANSSVKVGDGFMVLVTGGTPSLSYNAAKGQRNRETETINLIATGNEGKDNLIINLAGQDEKGFSKLDNFNSEVAEIYISVNGSRYAIMSYDENVTEIPVSFDAKQMGNYTIKAIADGKFSSVILLDRFTGAETNLLIEGYSFTSSSDENHDRFIVKLVNGQQSTDNSQFAYVSGEDLILNIEGSVQIIDMMGRVVYSNDVINDNNRINISGFNNAAYLIRVVNENGVKVQKIIL